MATKDKNVRPEDLLDVSQLRLLSKDSVLVGGTAITVMLGADKTSHYRYPRSTDIDVISQGAEVGRLKRQLGAPIVENLTDHHMVRLASGIGVDREKVVEEKSPFTVIRFPNSRLDIFTTVTGLGPIKVNARVFKSAVKYTFAGMELKVAHPSYIIATTINPLVATDNRIFRSFLVISDYALKNGNDALFKDVMAPAVSYIIEGSDRVNKELKKIRNDRRYSHIFKGKKREYLEYDKYFFSSLPGRLETERRKIVSFALAIGIGTKDQNTALVGELANFIRKSAQVS